MRHLVHDRHGWVWPAGDRITWQIVQHETSEIPRILEYVPHKGVCIQAGGNCGLWVLPLAEAFETVYTFEPDALNFYCLAQNVDRDNVVKLNAALGDSARMVDLDRPMGQANHGAHHVANRTGRIPMFRIDDFDWSRVDLIQLDIEGAETLALKGAVETLATHCPVVVLEMRNHSHQFGATDPQVRDWLAEHGYRLRERLNHDEIFTKD